VVERKVGVCSATAEVTFFSRTYEASGVNERETYSFHPSVHPHHPCCRVKDERDTLSSSFSDPLSSSGSCAGGGPRTELIL
jgi:hypothetical protein